MAFGNLTGAAALGLASILVVPVAAEELPTEPSAGGERAPALNVISPLYRNNNRAVLDAARGAARLSDSGTTSGRFNFNLRRRFGVELEASNIGGLKIPQERWQGERKPMMGISIKQRF